MQRSPQLLSGSPPSEESGNGKGNSQNNHDILSQIMANSSKPSFHDQYGLGTNSSSGQRTHKCCVYIASNNKYCVRVNSIQAYIDVNRDVSIWTISFVLLKYCIFIYLFGHCLFNWIISPYSYVKMQVIGDASHLSGYSFSSQNNIIHPSAELGSKTTVS